ncbi:Acyltransferase family protein [anaerobic digester metagenome]
MALPHADRIVAFDVIRVIAITMILFSHMLSVGDSTLLETFKGLMGVTGNGLFFFMSGHLIYSNNNSFSTLSSVIRFYKRRAIRIYPLYWIALLLFIVVSTTLSMGDYTTQTLFTYLVGAQVVFMPRYIADIPYYWFVSAILLFYLIYPYIIQSDHSTKNYIWRSLIVLGLLFLIRVSTGLIEGRFFEYFPVFVLGILSSREDFLSSATYHNIRKISPAMLCFCIFIAGITKPAMFDRLQALSLELMLTAGLVVLLRIVIILSAMVVLYRLLSGRLYASFEIQVISSCAVASYAVYLFHNSYYVLLDLWLSQHVYVGEYLKSAIFLSAGVLGLFVVAYSIQKTMDEIQNSLFRKRIMETFRDTLRKHHPMSESGEGHDRRRRGRGGIPSPVGLFTPAPGYSRRLQPGSGHGRYRRPPRQRGR